MVIEKTRIGSGSFRFESAGGTEKKLHHERVNFLSRPGSVLATKKDITSKEFSSEVRIVQNGTVDVEIILDTEMLSIIEESGAQMHIQLRSNLAQLGLFYEEKDLLPITVGSNIFKLKLKNAGPNEIIIQRGHALSIGNLYGYQPGKMTNSQLREQLNQFKTVNKSSTGKGNKFMVLRDVETNTDLLGIEMKTLLFYKKILNKIFVNKQFPRGTERNLLHSLLGIDRLDLKTYKNYISSKKNKVDKLQGLFDFEILDIIEHNLYLLMQTHGPIHYPDGKAIIMKKGVILDTEGKTIGTFDHGPSRLGQHRKHDLKSKDPEHPLIGEFFYSAKVILDYLMKDYKVYMLAEPVDLMWFE
jgi:hypothetical protein